MSNLGLYQIMTTTAKKVGGPLQLFGIIAGGGVIIGGGAVAAGTAIKKKIDNKLEQKKLGEKKAIVYTIRQESVSNEGLLFRKGDKFKVLELDGDAALIEIMENVNNPYFVSAKFLSNISNYNKI